MITAFDKRKISARVGNFEELDNFGGHFFKSGYQKSNKECKSKKKPRDLQFTIYNLQFKTFTI